MRLAHLPPVKQPVWVSIVEWGGERIVALRAFFLSVYGSEQPRAAETTSPLVLPLQTQFEYRVRGDGVCLSRAFCRRSTLKPTGPRSRGERTRGGCKKFAITLDRLTFFTRCTFPTIMVFSLDVPLPGLVPHDWVSSSCPDVG